MSRFELALTLASAAAPSGSTAFVVQIMPLRFIFIIFYFLMIRPQQKQRREMQNMLSNLQKGDRIVTRGGIVGTIDKVEEQTVRIEVGSGPKLRIQRDYVDRVIKE